jgi:hypothetical protein
MPGDDEGHVQVIPLQSSIELIVAARSAATEAAAHLWFLPNQAFAYGRNAE